MTVMPEAVAAGLAIGFAAGVVLGTLAVGMPGARMLYVKITKRTITVFRATGLSPTRVARLLESGPTHFLNAKDYDDV